jgi:hypothetical protein
VERSQWTKLDEIVLYEFLPRPKATSPAEHAPLQPNVTFMRKTGPFPSWRYHNWSILPPKYRRTVSGTSLGKVAFRCSCVRGAKNRPIARIFVVGTGGKPPTEPAVAYDLRSRILSIANALIFGKGASRREGRCSNLVFLPLSVGPLKEATGLITIHTRSRPVCPNVSPN